VQTGKKDEVSEPKESNFAMKPLEPQMRVLCNKRKKGGRFSKKKEDRTLEPRHNKERIRVTGTEKRFLAPAPKVRKVKWIEILEEKKTKKTRNANSKTTESIEQRGKTMDPHEPIRLKRGDRHAPQRKRVHVAQKMKGPECWQGE